MSRSEFRYNKKRKHYCYIFKDAGSYKKNLVITSKPTRKFHGRIKKNIKLYKNPNNESHIMSYIVPRIYVDDINSFDSKILNWQFDNNDKRKIKRLIKHKKAQ